MKTLGIDIGTTTISAVIWDAAEQSITESRTIANDSFIETEYSWERVQNAAKIVQRACSLLDEILDQHDDIVSIGLTGQMHGILYVDENGNSLGVLYTWQDGRGNLREFEGKSLVEIIKETCKADVSSGYGMVTHAYNVRKKLVPPGAVSFCTIADYLGMVLTGRKTPLMHISNAASLGLFDCETNTFRLKIIEDMVGTGCRLPEVTSEAVKQGEYRNLPVMVAIGDNQASFLGAAGQEKGTVLLNVGTGGQVSVLTDHYCKIPDIDVRPFINGSYLLVGASLCGGRAYAILERFFRHYVSAALGRDADEQYSVMGKLAELAASGNDSMKASTLYNGTRRDPELKGSFYEITETNFTPESLIYSVIEGIARELYDMYCRISEETGIYAENVIGSGNGLRKNNVLQEVFESFFHKSVKLSLYQEEAACGAAKLCIAEG